MSRSLTSAREEGFRVLLKELGPVGTVDFLRQLENGTGNYTNERERLLENDSVDVIVERIKKRKLGEG